MVVEKDIWESIKNKFLVKEKKKINKFILKEKRRKFDVFNPHKALNELNLFFNWNINFREWMAFFS